MATKFVLNLTGFDVFALQRLLQHARGNTYRSSFQQQRDVEAIAVKLSDAIDKGK